MQTFKSHKTVEQIAKKHRLDVAFIQKQLKMGIPIEHEHTKDKDLATDIALQHLEEIPDYYTRLKKMEADAKNEHKKFKDVKEETKSGDEGLHDWFGKSKSSDGKKGWVQLGGKYAGKPCARQPGQTSTPKCGSSKMKKALSKDEEESARRRKNRLDPNQPEKTGGAKPTNVRTEEMDLQEVKDKPGKGSGKKDACYQKVKSRYDVWPSAYASGALVKCRKVGADNWGTKSEATMHEEKRYCPLCDKKETRSECSYGEKTWDKVSVRDEEYSMVRSELKIMLDAIKKLQIKVEKGEGNLEAWVQSKITKAADYIDTAADYVASGEVEEQKMVDKILDELKEEDPCWKGYSQVGMKIKNGKKVPNCVELKKSSKTEQYEEELTKIEDANGNLYAEIIDVIKPEPIKGFKSQIQEATRLQSETGNIIAVILSWRGKTYSIRMFFPQASIPSKKEVATEIQKIYPGSIVLQFNVSTIQAGMPLIQVVNSKSKNYLLNNKTIGEETIEEVAAWQRKEGKNQSGGLNEKGRKSYERENPGSDLKAPSKKVGNPRRASFCARMKGMKSKLTSAKTANDPNSRINKSLRAWNC